METTKDKSSRKKKQVNSIQPKKIKKTIFDLKSSFAYKKLEKSGSESSLEQENAFNNMFLSLKMNNKHKTSNVVGLIQTRLDGQIELLLSKFSYMSPKEAMNLPRKKR